MNVDEAIAIAAKQGGLPETDEWHDEVIDALDVLAAEVERLRDELDRYKKSLPVCEKHKPDSCCRSGCMICGLEKQSSALSRIDYACGEPNEMQMSLYGLDYDEERVVQAVQRLKAELAATKAASVVPVELVALGDADWECGVGVKCKSSEDADILYNWLRDRTKDTTPPQLDPGGDLQEAT